MELLHQLPLKNSRPYTQSHPHHHHGAQCAELTKTDLATAEQPTPRCLHFTHSLRWHHSNVSQHSQSDGRLSLQFTPANQWAAGAQWGNGVGNAQLCLYQQNNKAWGVILDVQGSGIKKSSFSLYFWRSLTGRWNISKVLVAMKLSPVESTARTTTAMVDCNEGLADLETLSNHQV